ncbi:MAG TPA: hypothetical protein VED41_00085 [Solirubrobacteraceae bacterium]|nr:hypothetical protein [Solirubrobacteraceae bacterium]
MQIDFDAVTLRAMLGLGGNEQGAPAAQRAVLSDTLPATPAKPPTKWREEKPGRTALFTVGIVLLLGFLTGAIVGQTDGTKKTTTTTGGTSTTATTTTPSAAKEEAKPTTTTTASKEETKTATSEAKTVETKTVNPTSGSGEVTKNAPSDTFLLALLGTGVGLVLAGALYSRLTTIKLPGGVELDLKESAALGAGVADKAAPGASAQQVAAATVVAHEAARATKVATGQKLDDDVIDLAVEEGLKALGIQQPAAPRAQAPIGGRARKPVTRGGAPAGGETEAPAGGETEADQ